MSLYARIDKAIMKILRTISYAAVFFLVLIMLMAFFNVIGEKLGKSIDWISGIPNSTYWIQYWHIPTVFLTIAYVTLSTGHTRIDLVVKRYPKILRKIVMSIANLISSVICGFVAWRGWTVMLAEQIKYGSTFNGLSDGFPEWPFGLVYCLGLSLTSLAFLWAIVRLFCAPDNMPEKSKPSSVENTGVDKLMD